MKYEKPTIYNTAEQNKRIFDELSVAKAVIENNNKLITDLSKKVERLQEQLADASKTIDYYDKKDFYYTLADGTVMGAEPAHKYFVKWGIK